MIYEPNAGGARGDSSAKSRKLVFSRQFTSLATHTIEVRPVGDGRVYLDAFLVLR
jgi:hypothetical protein